jgi:hypothetical protein
MMTFFWRHFLCYWAFFLVLMLLLFLVQGPIIKPATEFFTPLLFPFLSWHMMGNNIIRAGEAKFAMVYDYSRYCQHYIRYYFL